MLVVNKAARAERAPVTIPLGHGATATARALDTFERKFVMAEARAELTALLADAPTKRPWASLPRAHVKAAAGKPDAETALLMWMDAVLLAAACVTALDGVVDEAGEAIAPSFELFELLFIDAETEAMFKIGAPRLEQIWASEKNASASGPNGSGPEALSSALDAPPPATLAPAAESATSPIAPEAPAPYDPTRHEPPKESSPGDSPAAALGASQD